MAGRRSRSAKRRRFRRKLEEKASAGEPDARTKRGNPAPRDLAPLPLWHRRPGTAGARVDRHTGTSRTDVVADPPARRARGGELAVPELFRLRRKSGLDQSRAARARRIAEPRGGEGAAV